MDVLLSLSAAQALQNRLNLTFHEIDIFRNEQTFLCRRLACNPMLKRVESSQKRRFILLFVASFGKTFGIKLLNSSLECLLGLGASEQMTEHRRSTHAMRPHVDSTSYSHSDRSRHVKEKQDEIKTVISMQSVSHTQYRSHVATIYKDLKMHLSLFCCFSNPRFRPV